MESETNIVTAKDKLNRIDQILDAYEQKVGLPSCKSPGTEEELNQYLNMDRTSMESLDMMGCAEIGYRLSQYAFYIQRLFNRETARVIWAKQELTDVISKSLVEYDKYMKFDTKVALIIKENGYANSVQKIVIYAEQRAKRLEFLSTSIKNIGEAMKSMQLAKSQMSRNQ
jgi:hypothetical protein